MANAFDMVNEAIADELERLGRINPKYDEGKAEIERAKAVHLVCTSAIDNANAAINAVNMAHRVTGKLVDNNGIPRLLGGGNA